MKRIYFVAILLTTAYSVLAQRDLKDLKKEEAILLNKLNITKTDSSKIVLLTELSNLFFMNHYDREAIPYALQVLQLRQKSNQSLKIASTLTFIGQAYLNSNRQDSARIFWEKALAEKKALGDTTFETDIYKNIGLIYFNAYNFPKSREYYTKALALSRLENRLHDVAICNLFLGRIAKQTADGAGAELHFSTALKINKENNFDGDVAVVLTELSELSASKGDFTQATDYVLQSLKIGEQLKDNQLIFTNLNSLGILFTRNLDFDSAFVYLVRAEKLAAGDEELKVYITGNIGVVYMAKRDFEKAKSYLTESLKFSEVLGLTQNISSRLNNLGDIALAEKKYADALPLFHRSLMLSDSISDADLQARNLGQLGKLYFEMVKDSSLTQRPDSLQHVPATTLLKRSKAYLNRAINICIQHNKLDLLQENYRLLSYTQHELNDEGGALKSYTQHILYRDSVISLEKRSNQIKLINQQLFENKLSIIEKQNAVNKAKAKARQILFIIGGVGCLFIALLTFYYLRKIEKNKFELLVTQLRMEALNAQISDHFISNAMDSIERFTLNNQKEKASEYLGKFRDLVRDVLINSGKSLITLKKDLHVLESYIELEALRFAGKGLHYSIEVDNAVDPETTLVPPMLLQIQAENSIKHGFKKTKGGNLVVSIRKKEEHIIVCRVEDDGAGRMQAESEVGAIERTSVGSKLAERIVSTMSKHYRYEIIDLLDNDQQPVGTAVEFTLPYNHLR